MRKLFKWTFNIKGWKIVGDLPAGHKKCVVIAAPYTSNWDFVYSLAVFFKLKVPVRFLAKKEIFKWPVKKMIEDVGGIAVTRHNNNKLVQDIIELFNSKAELMLMIPAEGTRSRVSKWKTGFYHVALGANVPVLPGYLNYEKKTAGFGPLLHLTGNPITDANLIKDFYRDIKGKFPENFDLEGLVLG